MLSSRGSNGTLPRVVVTGVGLVTALGLDAKTTWNRLVAGQSALRPISSFEASAEKMRVAGEVSAGAASSLAERLAPDVRGRTERFTHFACAAAHEALEAAGRPERVCPEEYGVIAGVGLGVPPPSAGYKVGPTSIIRVMPNAAPAWISILEGLKGPSLSCSTACASGGFAIGLAFDQIRLGYAKGLLAGGVDTVITRDVARAYAWMRAINIARDEAPASMSRPFDATRRGFVLGEGAGFLMLEERDSAMERGAGILAELCGWGASSDAHSIVAVGPDGEGMARAIENALMNARLPKEAIDYISAHGTSTRMNDREETRAIRKVFGLHADRLLVSSQKSMLGHTMGAAGAIEAVVTVQSIHQQVATPTINLQHSDPECDLDYVPNVARNATMGAALSHSFGFGGHNSALVFAHPDVK